MGDAGEGLIDAEARIQERMEEAARERAEKRLAIVHNPEPARALDTLRLARIELDRQLHLTTHEARKKQLVDALAEVDRQMAKATARLT